MKSGGIGLKGSGRQVKDSGPPSYDALAKTLQLKCVFWCVLVILSTLFCELSSFNCTIDVYTGSCFKPLVFHR